MNSVKAESLSICEPEIIGVEKRRVSREETADTAAMMKALPRLLVISRVIPQTKFAGSIMLYRLFQDYPTDKLFVAGAQADERAEVLDCHYKTLSHPLENLHLTRFADLARSLRAAGFLPQASVKELQESLDGFRPEVVLTVMEEQAYYYTAYRFARKYNLPLVLLIHDLPDVFDKVYDWAARRQQAKNEQVYRYAAKRISVSPEMRDHLAERYGATGDFLYPNRSTELSPRPLEEARTLKRDGILTIAYAGALGFGRGYMLDQVIPSLRAVGARLHIYSNDSWAVADADVMIHRGYAPPAETWARVKAECDALLLPYRWPDEAGNYADIYDTSFPSKLPEYLALGMPVLMLGPKETLGIKWGLNHPQAALVVTENDPTAWTAALRQLKESASLRKSLSRNALLAGAADFDPVMIRNRFFEHLVEVAQK